MSILFSRRALLRAIGMIALVSILLGLQFAAVHAQDDAATVVGAGGRCAG